MLASQTIIDPEATVPLLRDGSQRAYPWDAPVPQGITGQVARHHGLSQFIDGKFIDGKTTKFLRSTGGATHRGPRNKTLDPQLSVCEHSHADDLFG